MSTKIHHVTDVHKAFQRSAIKDLTPVFLDSTYCSRTLSSWKRTLQSTRVDKLRWKRDVFDCDNFALEFAAKLNRRLNVNGIGIVIDISNRHAYNVILARTRRGLELMVVEPQNDRINMKYDNPADQGLVIFF